MTAYKRGHKIVALEDDVLDRFKKGDIGVVIMGADIYDIIRVAWWDSGIVSGVDVSKIKLKENQ